MRGCYGSDVLIGIMNALPTLDTNPQQRHARMFSAVAECDPVPRKGLTDGVNTASVPMASRRGF
jgi:hypothetical protein